MANSESRLYSNFVMQRTNGSNELPSFPRTDEFVTTYDQSPNPGFLDYWRIIKKRRSLIAIVFLLVFLSAALVTFIMTPIYTAETTLLIDPLDRHIVDIRQVVSEPQRFE